MTTHTLDSTGKSFVAVTEPSKIPYILFYRQGSNPHPQFFLFYHESADMRKVVERIKKHCELMNLRFVNVRKFVVDLEEVENKAFGQPEGE